VRPDYGDTFEFERILYPFFYTSNSDKLIQARLVFSRFGFRVRHYRSEREPYDEDYSLGTEVLLENALRQVRDEFSVRSAFFVEDTSLRIEALSEAKDYPGLAVKEWFAQVSFDDLDKQIRLRGGNRSAVVKSDIALRIPGLSRPVFFHGESRGTVALTAPEFEGWVQYPWLTPDTFNGWFIPEGATKRLGEMEFEESLDFDFRSKALIQLVRRLEELSAALNLGRSQYYVRRPALVEEDQLPLLTDTIPPVYIVVGHKCAGKTTFSDIVGTSDNVVTLEGSTVLRDLARKEGCEIDSSEEAKRFLLEKGLDCVAVEIGRYIAQEPANTYVVSGLRTVEEASHLLTMFSSARLIWIEADKQERFERHLRRARDRDVKTLLEFEEQDERQREFGLLRIGVDLADHTIRNDQSLDEFRTRVRQFVRSPPGRMDRSSSPSELQRCLEALASFSRSATCQEISDRTAAMGGRVRRYNTNRALKGVPEFAQRLEPSGGKLLRYRITYAGRALMDLFQGRAQHD